MKYKNSEKMTETEDMPQFGFGQEVLFMFEILLSPERF